MHRRGDGGPVQQPTIAIVGSGPAGCYCAQFARKRWPAAEITVFEALPTPYGLLRYGVAPDHQGTKAITSQFARLFDRDDVRFAGNVHVGHDLPWPDVTASFDVVIVATGLPQDRVLEAPVEAGCPVVGAGTLIQALNGYPGGPDGGRLPPVGERVAIVGNGNVALDALRLICSREEDLRGSDIDDASLARLRPRLPRRVDVLGRSPAPHAKFDLAMLREVALRPQVVIAARGLRINDNDPRTQFLREHISAQGATRGPAQAQRPVEVTFWFGATPLEIVRTRDGARVHIDTGGAGRVEHITVDTTITAIGFCSSKLGSDEPSGGRPTVFSAGWAAQAGGAIPAHRRDAKALIDSIYERIQEGRIETGRKGYSRVAPLVHARVVSFPDWKRLDAFEQGSAGPNRCRRKVTDLNRMLAIARGRDLQYAEWQERSAAVTNPHLGLRTTC